MDHGSLHDMSLNDASDLRAIEFVSAGCAIAASEGHCPYSKFACLLDQRTCRPRFNQAFGTTAHKAEERE
jgi:hypothetical protein